MAGSIVPIPIKFYKALASKIEFRDGLPYCDGKITGSVKRGYRTLTARIDGQAKKILAHRLHWFMVYGEVPLMLDHRDRDGDNNRIENLRVATHSQNRQNYKRLTPGTSSFHGVSSVHNHGKRRPNWRARIKVQGKHYHLGVFATEEAAAKAYDDAVVRLGLSEFSVLNFPSSVDLRTGGT